MSEDPELPPELRELEEQLRGVRPAPLRKVSRTDALSPSPGGSVSPCG